MFNVQLDGSKASVGSTFKQDDIARGRAVYIHDGSDTNNDSLLYGLGLTYGSQQLALDTTLPPHRWYFSHRVLLPVVIEQARF